MSKIKTRFFDKILFLGIGGGNDIFSTLLAMSSLWQVGWRWKKAAVAGVLSPFHRHSVTKTSVPGVFITTPKSERFLIRKNDQRKIGFVDAIVAQLIKQEKPYGVKTVYGFSIKNGSEGLTESFKKLAYEFDYIVLVDIGGDCFYSGNCDKHILSPMFDATCIRAFIDSGVSGILFEAGPGTDGELEPEALKKVLSECNAASHPLSEDVIDWLDIQYKKWIKKTRPGRTIPITIEAFRSSQKKICLEYRARAHIGSTRFYTYFQQTIDTALCKNFYLIDPTKIGNPFAVRSTDPMDWFKKTQVAQQHTNCEANLEYLQTKDGLMQFLTPSPLLKATDRSLLIHLGLDELNQGVCDLVLIFKSSWEMMSRNWKLDFDVSFQKKTVIVKSKGGK